MSTFDAEAILDTPAIAHAADLQVLDAKGERAKFGSIFAEEKAVVVFVRHWGCGSCQAYVENLARVPTSALDAAHTKIVVVGCGEYEPIQAYQDTTGFQGPVYADPTRSVFRALGMTLETLAGSPAGQPRPGYLAHMSAFTNVVKSIWRGPVKHPTFVGKQGNISQVGGDFVFGPGNQCTFTSRMKNTEDHVPVVELMKAAGVEYTDRVLNGPWSSELEGWGDWVNDHEGK